MQDGSSLEGGKAAGPSRQGDPGADRGGLGKSSGLGERMQTLDGAKRASLALACLGQAMLQADLSERLE